MKIHRNRDKNIIMKPETLSIWNVLFSQLVCYKIPTSPNPLKLQFFKLLLLPESFTNPIITIKMKRSPIKDINIVGLKAHIFMYT